MTHTPPVPPPARHRDERGISESLQWAILWPLVMLVVLGTIQIGIWWHVRLTAGEAAASAADALAIAGTRPDHAEAVARQVAASGGLDAIRVDTHVDAVQARVVVGARAPLVVDLGLADVEMSAVAPMEAVQP